jgi:hypothetical protein
MRVASRILFGNETIGRSLGEPTAARPWSDDENFRKSIQCKLARKANKTLYYNTAKK